MVGRVSAYAGLRPGCVVRLKGGTVHMTVEHGDDADKVRRCLWFDAQSVLHRATIDVLALEPVPAEVQP